MSSTVSRKQNAAQKPSNADDYVWTAISYLDSPTDSPKCLQGGNQPEIRSGDEPLIFLDDLPRGTPWNSFVKFLIGSIFLLIVLIFNLRG